MQGLFCNTVKSDGDGGASEPDAALCRGVRMSSLTFLMPWPASNLSPNARQHWSALARAKKVQRVAWAVHARSQGAGRLLAERAELRLQFHPPTKARRDLDNCLAACKAGLDGLADVLGIDDSQWSIQIEMAEPVKGGSVRVEVAPCHSDERPVGRYAADPGVTVVIEELN